MNERTKAIISAAVVLAVNIAALFGVSMDYETWFNGLCAIAMLAASAWGIWKNHNFTWPAMQGQLVINQLKNEQRAMKVKED